MTRTEFRLFLREPVTVVFTLALPLMVLYILNGVFGGDAPAASEPDFPVYGGYSAPDWYTPAYVALAVAGFAMIALPAHLVDYRETGVLRRFQASGVPRGAVLLSQLLVALAIVTAGVVLLLFASVVLGSAAPPENPWLFLAAYLLGAVAVAAFGIMLGTVLPTTRSAQAVGLLLWFVFLFLSGAGPPPEVLPDNLQAIGEWLPLTPIIRLMQEPWLTGGWAPLESLIAAGIAAASGLIAWFAYRWE